MDVIITAPQGGGKSTAAMVLATGYLNAHSWNDAQGRVLTITGVDGPHDSPAYLAECILRVNARVVIFDNCLRQPRQLQHAVRAVQLYRERYEGKASALDRPLLAIYINQGDAVKLAI